MKIPSSNSGDYVIYVDHTNSEWVAESERNSARSDSVSGIIKNGTFYVQVDLGKVGHRSPAE